MFFNGVIIFGSIDACIRVWYFGDVNKLCIVFGKIFGF